MGVIETAHHNFNIYNVNIFVRWGLFEKSKVESPCGTSAHSIFPFHGSAALPVGRLIKVNSTPIDTFPVNHEMTAKEQRQYVLQQTAHSVLNLRFGTPVTMATLSSPWRRLYSNFV